MICSIMSTPQVQSLGKKGSLVGSALLIIGCCIGAGMLGLPLITVTSGFLPSVIAILFCWFFMISTGLLLLEVNLWFKEEVNLISMAEAILGKVGKYLCLGLFVFLFYSLTIAYISGTGELITKLISRFLGRELPSYSGALLCSLFLAPWIYKGTRSVDRVNGLFVWGMMISYLALICVGTLHVFPSNLMNAKYGKEMVFSLPVILTAFGYQNLIPSLTTYLERDVKKIRLAIVIGCSCTLLIYLLWEGIILGMIPQHEVGAFANKQASISQLLGRALPSSSVVLFMNCFAFFALVTSLLTVALGSVDFLADMVSKKTNKSRFLICCLVWLPPLIFAIQFPHFFMTALNYAGGLGAVLLFGAIPVWMVWVGRYKKNLNEAQLLPGGKIFLSFLLAASLGIFAIEFLRQLRCI